VVGVGGYHCACPCLRHQSIWGYWKHLLWG